ncbi:hypothetical protein J6590_003700 [Homalodisca vitripennis]|nr:hypothetical protein J6590_003700 [Homalodisca vitripennis]
MYVVSQEFYVSSKEMRGIFRRAGMGGIDFSRGNRNTCGRRMRMSGNWEAACQIFILPPFHPLPTPNMEASL